MAVLEVYVTSTIFNVSNFILFDIILASLVFYLTADIAGLVNSASALQQLGNRLHAYNPPIVGVGLTCTRRNVFRVLAGVRGLAMLAVLATNFLIEGRSIELERIEQHDVVVPGVIDPDTKQIDVRRLTLRRRGCQGRKNDEIYYGELRADIQECELRQRLFSFPAVHFGTRFVNRTIDFPADKCVFSSEGSYSHVHRFVCKGFGVIGCFISRETNRTKLDTCEGVVRARESDDANSRRVAHICSGEAMFPGLGNETRGTNMARCRLARNLDVDITTWVPLLSGQIRTLRDGIDAVYGAGKRSMKVKVSSPDKTKEIAEVDLFWFYILGAKLFAILALIVIDLILRSRGLIRAANDELGLGSLLAQSTLADPLLEEEEMERAQREPVAGVPGAAGLRRQLVVQNEGGVLRARTSR